MNQTQLCVICGQLAFHRHYNAPTCLACRSFFKRSALMLKQYACQGGSGKCCEEGAACRACRMDKCILAGMDINTMRLPDASHKGRVTAFLDKRRHILLMAMASGKQNSRNGITSASDHTDPFSEIASMVSLEKLVRKFFTVERSFKRFLEQFASLSKLLEFGQNMLSNCDKFTEFELDLSNDHKYAVASRIGSALCPPPVHMMMELISMLEIFRQMPIYWRLSMEDRQVSLLNYVMLPQLELFNKFHSARRNSAVVVKLANGFNIWHLFCNNGIYEHDKILLNLADHIFRLALVPFQRISQLSTEEFVLLRAILFCHSAISALSPEGHQTVQREGERYARMLMGMLQARLGAVQGARRFADCMHLAECVFRSADKLREFFTYLAMVSEHHRFHCNIPPVFRPLCLN